MTPLDRLALSPILRLIRWRLAPEGVLVLLILGFAFFFGGMALQQHQAFLTHGLDLGNVDQALWNTAQGRFLAFSLMTPVQSRLALHVEPILLVFVPFYWLNLGSPELLLVTQAAVVALGAWPLYRFTTRNYDLINRAFSQGRGREALRWVALLVPLAYLLLPTLESAVLFDFHAVTMAPTFLLFAFVALAQRQDWRFALFAGMAMACKEDMPLIIAMLGVYGGIAQRRWSLAGLTIGLSMLWFITAFFVVQPYFAVGGNIQLDRYAWLGETPGQMLQTIITQPVLIFDHLWVQADLPGYLARLLFPTAFLALFSPLTLLPLLPTIAINLLSGNPFTWRLEDFHYGAPLAPFLFISAIYGICHIAAWIGRRARSPRSEGAETAALSRGFSPAPLLIMLTVLLFICSGIYHYYRGFTPLARPFAWPEVTARHHQLKTALRAIPAGTPLFAQPNLAPHLAHRPVLYNDFAYFTDPTYAAQPVQDIVLDVASLENFRGLHEFLRHILLESESYQLVTAQDGLLHFRPLDPNHRSVIERYPALETPPEPLQFPEPFYTFTQADTPLEYELPVDFGEMIRLHGYSLHFNRQEEIQVTVDLEALQPLESIQPVLYLLDTQGRPIGSTIDLQPALVWFPVEQWPAGQIVRVRFNTFPWYTRETPAYRLALGVVKGADPWANRQRPSLSQPTDLAIRFPADGDLIELAYLEQIEGIPGGSPRYRQFTQPSLSQPLQANFGEQVSLLGASSPRFLDPATLSVSLYWQATAQPETLTRFVQLVSPAGQVYGQHDSVPDYGTYPTASWQPGEVVTEQVTLAIQTERPAGPYTLHIGLYRPATGERLRLPTGEDHLEIAVPE